MGHIPGSVGDVKSRHVRAMATDDIPAIRVLFQQVFRPNSKSCNENFDQYFRQLFFENPHYDPALGSVVHENERGEIDSVISILPVPYVANGQPIMGRLLCAFMMKPGGSPRGAAELVLTMRPSEKTINFSDSASPVSLKHWEAVGGVTLSVHALQWTRVFKIASFMMKYVAQRRPMLGRWAGNSVAKFLNPLFPFPPSEKAARSRATVREIAQDEASAVIPALLRNYPVRPDWTENDLNWLLGLASANRAAGTLRFFAITDRANAPSGFFCCYSRSNGVVEVLNVIARSGTERDAVDAMLLHLQEEGHIAVQGRVDPRYLTALSQQPGMFFRHAANVCIATTRAEILNAVPRNDVFVGGLAGEGWSRLSTDFF